MSDKQRNALTAVENFIRRLNQTGEAPEVSFPSRILSSAEEGSLYLDEEEARSYWKCIHGLMEAFARKEDVSRRAVEMALQEAVFFSLDIRSKRSALSFEARLEKAVSQLRKFLVSKHKVYLIYFPVSGIDKADLPITLGGVRFLSNDDLPPSIFSNAHVPRIVDAGFKSVMDSPRAEIRVRAKDGKAAEDLALKHLRRLADVLNFFAGLMPPRKHWLYPRGDCEEVVFTVPVVEEEMGSHPRYDMVRIGPLIRLSLRSLLQFDEEYEVGLGYVLDVFERNRNTFEDRLLTAMQWAGRATIESRREEAFLLFAIALESVILMDNEPVELTYRLTTRIAHLLGSDYESRSEIARRVAQLYRIRSKIVHSGEYQLTDYELEELKTIVQRCIHRLCTEDEFRKMSSPQDLVGWFNRRIFG